MSRGTLKDLTAETDSAIGQRIRHFRRHLGLSQSDIAAALGVSFQQMQKYENGRNRVSVSALILICKALGVTPNDIIGSFLDDAPASLSGRLAEENAQLKERLATIGRAARGEAAPDHPAAA